MSTLSCNAPVPSYIAMIWNPKLVAILQLSEAISLKASDVVLNRATRTPAGAFMTQEMMAAAAAADNAGTTQSDIANRTATLQYLKYSNITLMSSRLRHVFLCIIHFQLGLQHNICFAIKTGMTIANR